MPCRPAIAQTVVAADHGDAKRDFVASVMEGTDAKAVLKFALTKREVDERTRARTTLSEIGP